MQAGSTLHVTGSDIVAAQDVTGVAANVVIDGSQTNRHHDETHESRTTGFSITASAPVIDAAQNTLRQASSGARSQDDRASALHVMAAASGAYDAAGAANGAAQDLAAGKMPDAKLELSWGSSSSKSTFTQDSSNTTGSTVKAGGTAAFVATGGNVDIAGSDVNASNVILSAANQVNLTNSTDTDSTRSTNESKSTGVGVSVGTGGIGVDASMSKAHGNANSDSTASNNTHINAANNATIISGGDTNLIGANVNGKSVSMDVGGNLNIAPTQDTSTSAAKQDSTGGGIAISAGGASGSFNHSSGRANGNYAGVTEQTVIHAGTDGFDITVKGGTDLKGGLIASDATPDKNTLTTGTLTFSDIQNSSSYDAKSSGFGGGASTGNGGNTYATHGNTSGSNTGGIAPMLTRRLKSKINCGSWARR
ncbi:hypothetical protein AX768_08500 [Burkholderia sp. PAMC 28687]|uniref:hemagglutinin repeat-containing protein n=1 Tax=Burkholderia sp. PAMC 28687 TaxID=1795874 RepID=UPI0007850F78|nr:hypothetical protein AX768_08500 [Burkholderia sp. PAMC 28687]